MFESLDEHIKHDEGLTRTQVLLRWMAALVATVVVMGGLYWGVRLLD